MGKLRWVGPAGSGVLLGLVASGAALFAPACEDSSSSSGNVAFEAGAQFDAPPFDSSTSDVTSPPPADGGADAPDGGPVLGPVTCGAPVDLAGLPANAVSSGLRAASLPGGKILLMWLEQATVGVFKPGYRIYDGVTWSATKLLASPAMTPQVQLAVDGAGNAYVAYQLAGQAVVSRTVLPAGATTFGAEATFAYDILGPELKLVALASGALLAYRSGSPYLATRYDVGSSTWGAPVTLALLTGAVGTLGSGTTNKAAAAWSTTSGVQVATFDGAAWAAPITDPTAPVLPTSDQTTVVTLANGDPYVAWAEFGTPTRIRGHRYHLAAQTWDAIETIFQGPQPGDLRLGLVVDAADRLTATFQGTPAGKSISAMVARNFGAGWTAFGLDGLQVKPTLDAFGNVYAESVPATGSSLLNRVGATSTTWLTPAPTGFTSMSGDPLQNTAVALDGANQAHVFALDGGKLRVVVCK